MASLSGNAQREGGLGRARRAMVLDPITRHGLTVTVAVLFLVSGGMLWVLGYNYDGLAGGALTKIHPATYLVFLIFAWRSCLFGNPVAYCVHVASRRPGAALMAMTAAMVLCFVILRQRPNMAGLVDTYLGSTLLVLMLAEDDERLMARLEKVVHAIMTCNALLGLVEFSTKVLIFPFRFDGQAFETDLRSSAFQGHPLINAAVTACYTMALISGAKNLPQGLRFAMIGLQCAALVAFGGRTAIVATILFGGCYGLYRAYGTLRHRRINLPAAALGVILLSMAPVALGSLIAYGFFDALLGRFVSDGGSANARVEMFEMFDYLTLRDIVVGPDIDLIESARRIHGLEWGIENPIIRMVLYQGAFVTLLMTMAFALFMYDLARRSIAGVWLPMLVWLILISTAESIASKTTLMSKFCIIILCFYRQPPMSRSAPVNRAAGPGRALR